MVNGALPPEYRSEERTLSGSELDKLMAAIGTDSPEKYKEISHSLMQLGRDASFTEGTTVRLSDIGTAVDRQKIFDKVELARNKIMTSALSDPEKETAVDRLYADVGKSLADVTFDTELERGNPFALQVESKARGSKTQLMSMISSPVSYKDAKGNTLPMLIRRSYAEGLKPWEHFAATFGARSSVVGMKLSVPLAGDLAKQLMTMGADLIVSEDDCGTLTGVPFDLDDPDNLGAVLAKSTGGFKAGQPMDPKTMAALKKQGYEKVLLRSPMTCQAKGGLCKQCLGQREGGKFPETRAAIGIQASSALAERVAQGMLGLKHEGRGKGALGGSKDTYTGFPVINQLVQVPETFRYRAAVSTVPGKVESVNEAPQGGYDIMIEGEKHYVEPGQTVEVKAGDTVDQGDQIGSGLLNPAEIVKYKGMGEGRKYLAERLTKVFRDSKLGVNRRNAEVVARELINRVDIDDPEGLGDYLPGDSVSYAGLAHSYSPRKGAQVFKTKKAVGMYLEQPVMHHTIGTKLTGKMADELESFGFNQVVAHDSPPGFTPIMERLRGAPQVIRKDWIAKLQGSGLKANLEKDIQSGASSDIHSTHPLPGLAYGVEFGESKQNKVTY